MITPKKETAVTNTRIRFFAQCFKHTFTALFALAIVLSLTIAVQADYAPDEIIIRIKPGKTAEVASLHSATGAQAKRDITRLGFQTLKLPDGVDRDEAIARYRKNPAVEYAGPNHVLRIASMVHPNDRLYREGVDLFDLGIYYTQPQWGLYNDGYNNGWGGAFRADIRAPEAWAINTGSPNVIIAVLDTGLNYNHPDLAGKIWINPNETPGNGQDDDNNGYVDDWRGWNFVADNNNPMDDHSEMGLDVKHGSFVSGIAAASTNNGIGMAGVSWGSPIMALKVMDASGYGLEDDAALAVMYAADNGAKIINMSLTGEDAPMFKAAIDYAWEKGCLIVAASGNAGISTPTFPASYTNVLSVGATNEYDQRCTAADWGQGGSNYGDYLDVMAPGNNILSVTDILDYNGYYVMPGTSAAAPFVAGVAALVWSQFPDWTNAQVKEQIKRTADDLGAPGWDVFTGWGRVNAFRALTEMPEETSKVSDLKTMPNNTTIVLKNVVLSTGSNHIPGRLYAQDHDRSSGILLSIGGNMPEGLAPGDRVDVAGVLGSVSGERALLGASVTKLETGNAPVPLVVSNKTMGGGEMGYQQGVVDQYSFPRIMASGLNNVGLLVTVYGKVTAVGHDWFYIDDGTGLDDGGAYTGIYVHHRDLQRPAIGKYAVVTGISGCDIPSGSPVARRVLRPRQQSDIRVVN